MYCMAGSRDYGGKGEPKNLPWLRFMNTKVMGYALV